MSQNNQNNNDLSGVWLVLGLAGAFFMALFLLVYALLLFGAFVLSIVALCAWNEPVTIGKVTLEPDEARAFIKRGLAGAFLLPAFVIFCELVFGVGMNGDYLLHVILGGYALGSLGMALLEDTDEAQAGGTIRQLPAPPPSQIAPPKDFIPQDQAPFRFARWDDEEERS